MLKTFPKFTEILVKNPAIVQGLFSVIDLIWKKSSSKMWSSAANFIGKTVTNVAGQAAGKGAAGVAGGVAVFTALLSGLDIGHGLGNMLFNGFNEIKDDEKDIISCLTYLKGDKNDEFSKLCDQLMGKLAGSSSFAADNAKKLSSQKPINLSKDIDENTIVEISKVASDIKNIMMSLDAIVEVLDILKKKETRDLYIKHSESIFGTIGRGVDATVNFAADLIPKALGLGEGSKQGENPTGFANTYNQLMDTVANMSGKLLDIQKAIMPHVQTLKQFEQKTKEMQQILISSTAGSNQEDYTADALKNLGNKTSATIFNIFTNVADELIKY